MALSITFIVLLLSAVMLLVGMREDIDELFATAGFLTTCGLFIPIVVLSCVYSSQVTNAEQYKAKTDFVAYCEETSLEMTQDYPQPVQVDSSILLQDAQNANTSSMSIQTRMQCLEEANLQAEREAALNGSARNILNWPIRGVLGNIRDDALQPQKE